MINAITTYFFMKNIKTIILLLTFVTVYIPFTNGQELECNVVVDDNLVISQDKEVFKTLQKSIEDFLNNTEWTDVSYQTDERIKCDFLITLGPNTTTQHYEATVQIQSIRPVYGTNYETSVLNFLDDKWIFNYSISQPLYFTDNLINNELTRLLAYYSYIIIGMDMNSFGLDRMGAYYQKSLNILNNAQESPVPGWNISGESNDRFNLATSLTNIQYQSFLKAIYVYHRKGLDFMESDPDQARENIVAALEMMKETQSLVTISVVIKTFFQGKHQELIQLFSKGDPAIRTKAMELLTLLDPSNSNKYKKIMK